MSITAMQLVGEISIQGAQQAKSDIQGVGQSATQTGGILKTALGGALSLAAGAAAQGLGFLKNQLVDSVKVAMQHQAVMSQTAQVIKSTGDVSGMTSAAIGNLATSLSHTTEFSNGAIQSGENLLLTFTGIGKNVFPEATTAMLDLSQATGQDMKSSAIQLGKALNDPLTGMSALQRVGVTFSASEQNQIKTMMAHNNTMGAQKVMLKELETEFGGSAAAAGKTFAGQIAILKNNFEELKQKIGGAILPVLTQFLGFVSGNILPGLQKFGSTIISALGGAFTYIKNVLRTINLSDFHAAWQAFGVVVQQTGMAFGKLGAAIHPVVGDFDPLAELIANLAKGALGIFTNLLWKVSEAFIAVDRASQQGRGPLQALGNIFNQLKPPIQNIITLLSGQFKQTLQFIGQEAQQVGQWFQSSVVPALKAALPGFLDLGKTILTTVIPALIQIRGVFMDLIEHAFKVLLPIVEQLVPPLIRLAGSIASGLASALRVVTPIIVGVAKYIGDFAKMIIDILAPVIQQIVTTFNTQLLPALKGLMPAFQALQPILTGIAAVVGGVLAVALGLLIGIFVGVLKGAAGLLTGLVQAFGGIVQAISGAVQTISGILGLLVDLFTGNFGHIQTDLNAITGGIVMMFTGFGNIIVGIFKGALGLITGLVSGFVQGVVGFFTHLYDTLVGHSIIPDMINGIVTWFQQLPGKVMAFVSGLVTQAISAFTGFASSAIGAAANLVGGFAGNIGALPGRAMGAINAFVGQAGAALGGLAGRAATWGTDMIMSLYHSIMNGIGWITSAASSIASTIAAHLHFSKPDIGPLADADKFMPDFTNLLADGLNTGLNKIKGASLSVAATVATSISPLQGGSSGGLQGIVPASVTQRSSPQIVVQAPPIYLDGRLLAHGLMPHITDNIRYRSNAYGM